MTTQEFLSAKDYWYAFVSAILGCVGGIQWAKWQMAAKQKKTDHEARIALLGAIEKILQLSVQASAQFQSGQPNFPLEVQRASFLCDRVSQFQDPAVRDEIEGLIYQCSHYNAKLTVVNSAYMTTLITNTSPAILSAYSSMMVQHLQQIVGWAQPIVAKLKKENP
ncbi:MAG TPA: hypothetical protein VHD62_14705 [Opitutaceae bacterium]|nr:hypothetical protein [Opitutaceae bacterium]